MSRRIAVSVSLAAVALVAIAFAAWTALGAFGPEPTDVPTIEARQGPFVRRVWADGNLEAAEATTLGPPPMVREPMRIAWLATDGTAVAAGDVVIRFDPTDMEEQLRQGRNDEATAESRIEQTSVRQEGAARNLERDARMAAVELDYAREFHSRDEQIFSRIEIVESEIDQALATERKAFAETELAIRGDLARVELELLALERRKAELQIDRAAKNLQQLEVRAPHAGIFTLKETWGRIPEVGQVVWGGNAVAEIPRLDEMQAKVYVLEADAGGLAPGIPARVWLDAHPDRVQDATVASVDALAQPRNRRVPVQYFAVVLALPETDPGSMKPGQRVQATLVLDEREDALTVPRQAVFEHEGETVVWVRRGEGFEPVPVELGPSGLGLQVIESGLEAGARVALRDPTRPVTPEAEADAPPAGAGGGPGASR